MEISSSVIKLVSYFLVENNHRDNYFNNRISNVYFIMRKKKEYI